MCIHGFPTSSWDYEPMWPGLTARFDVLASDLVALGRSAKPEVPLTVSMQASVIEGLCVSAGFERAHILAHDLGDTVAQELLARQVDGTSRVQWQSCVFLNGGLFPETHRPRLIQKLLLSPFGFLAARLSSRRTFVANMRRICSKTHPPSEEFLEASWALLDEGEGRAMLPRLIHYMDERRAYRERWVRPIAERIVPMRLVDGALDPVSGQHMAERYREIARDPDVVLLESLGHYPHVEDPEAVLGAFLEFHDALARA